MKLKFNWIYEVLGLDLGGDLRWSTHMILGFGPGSSGSTLKEPHLDLFESLTQWTNPLGNGLG